MRSELCLRQWLRDSVHVNKRALTVADSVAVGLVVRVHVVKRILRNQSSRVFRLQVHLVSSCVTLKLGILRSLRAHCGGCRRHLACHVAVTLLRSLRLSVQVLDELIVLVDLLLVSGSGLQLETQLSRILRFGASVHLLGTRVADLEGLACRRLRRRVVVTNDLCLELLIKPVLGATLGANCTTHYLVDSTATLSAVLSGLGDKVLLRAKVRRFCWAYKLCALAAVVVRDATLAGRRSVRVHAFVFRSIR